MGCAEEHELKKVDEKDNLYACSLDMSAKSIGDGFKFKFFTCCAKKRTTTSKTSIGKRAKTVLSGTPSTEAAKRLR